MKHLLHTACHLFFVLFLLTNGTGCRTEEGHTSSAGRKIDTRAVYYYSKAKTAYEQQSFSSALALTDSALSYSPDIPDFYMLRGHILHRVNRFDEAHVAYKRVVELDPEYRGGWFTIGNSAFFSSQYREAIPSYEQEMAVLRDTWERQGQPADHPLLSTIIAQIGRAYARLGVPDSARTAYEEAIEKDSSNATALGWLGELYQDEGKVEEAFPYAERALDLDPDNIETKYLVGILLFRTGRNELAKEYLEDVVRRQPWHEGANYNLGRVLMLLGQEEEGQQYLDKTDELQARYFEIERIRMNVFQYPTNPAQWIKLAELLREAGREAEAQEAYHIARDLSR